MNDAGFTLIGLTAVVAMLVGVLTFALLRFAAAVRTAKRGLREAGGESSLLTAALQEAMARLRTQEQVLSARAAAQQHLSDQIVSSLTAGLLVVGPEGTVHILNPAGRRLLGLPDNTPHDIPYRDLLEAAPPLADVIAECLAAGRPIVRRTVPLGGPIPSTHFGVTASPLTTSDGGRGVICLFSDLTQVVELEEQVRLKDALAHLGELTAGIAHEFRNGLATIHGYSRLLDPQALPPQYRQCVEGIRQESEALGKVVTNFLNFARPEQVAFGPVDLGALLRRVVEESRHELLPEGTTVVEGVFGTIEGDEVLLRQAFSNLLRNAVEACQGAGITPDVRITSEIDPAARSCRLTIDDNGPGIRPGLRDRVFRPFFTTRKTGTGLGLAIVQKVVVVHNGRIAAGESPSGGARFQITLPLGAG